NTPGSNGKQNGCGRKNRLSRLAPLPRRLWKKFLKFTAHERSLDAIRTEMRHHDLSHFMAQENKIVQPGCPCCRKAFYTVPQFIDHINDDVLPPLDRLSADRD